MGIDSGDKSNINLNRQYAIPIARLTSGIIVREGKSSPNTPLIPRGRWVFCNKTDPILLETCCSFFVK